ncbi:serine hydrolase domain-containing protein [Caulobacter mirabilis]|uniref:Beta-lactamase-related domain-containing protein n=1 Tax=Caulobacter mirabilis TaxID=69666 RepID=A0A2D2AX73_9CAUL|nr:serine hydrolase domain-containing protein [Caulobacter mirabilis]ATQ42537.1 hypothetical protein CSW64_09015 [Caulobacter mirabilis]
MIRRATVFAWAIAAAMIGRPAAAAPDAYEAYLTQCHAARVCNGVYLIARGGEPVFAGAVGEAGDPARTPLTRDAAFDIGSISKQMTAVAVLKLAEAGRLSVDDPVAAHLPQYPYAGVTIAQLLSHTSGTPDVLGDYAVRLKPGPDGAVPPAVDGSDIVSFLIALGKPAVAPPGARYAYNNTGYLVLAALVETISGEPFADHLQRRLFTPLGMTYTRLRTPSNEAGIAHRAYGFRPQSTERRPYDQIPGFYVRGAGGVYSTADDLLRWQRALNGGLVRADLWARATAPTRLTDGTSVPYGFGLNLKPDAEGVARISHGGHWRGFKSDLSYYPAADLIVIQLTNNAEDDSVDANVAALRRIAEGGRPEPVKAPGD